ALPIVAGLDDLVRREQYAGMLADLTGVTTSTVLLELERRGDRPERPQRSERSEARVTRRPGTGQPRTPTQELEKEALKLLAQAPEAARPVAAPLDPDHFETDRYRRVFAILRDAGGDAARLVERGGEEGLGELIAQLSVEPLTVEPTREYAERVFSRLEEVFLGRKIATMKRRLEKLNPTDDPRAYDSLFEELIALESQRRRIRTRAGEGV
ncbi:MAG TPA: hypothetical protein VF058_03665, partial [Actinomycetota bacterium]